MEVYLNHIDGVDDAIISMFLSKRTLTRELENEIRQEVKNCSAAGSGRLKDPTDKLQDWLRKLFKWGVQHITMLRFIDLSFSVYGLHRGGQDDLDSHAMRMNNRIIRSSTRLADFSSGEMSSYYEGKIVTTDQALAALGIELPEILEVGGSQYVRGVNGYILKGMEKNKDVKRGLYMLSIPSNFIFRINLTEFAHVYKERNKDSGANPEVKRAVENMVDSLEEMSASFINRDLLMAIKN